MWNKSEKNSGQAGSSPMAGGWHSCLQEEGVHFLVCCPASSLPAVQGSPGPTAICRQNRKKNTSYGSNHPPEALLPGLKHLGPVQVQETELTQFCIWDPTTELRHGKNSKQSRAQVHLNNISKPLYGAHHVPDIALNALYLLAHLILIKIEVSANLPDY